MLFIPAFMTNAKKSSNHFKLLIQGYRYITSFDPVIID